MLTTVPNQPFRKTLEAGADSWRLVHREAAGNTLTVRAIRGKVERDFPLLVSVDRKGRAECELNGGLGYVPVTFSGLGDCRGLKLLVNGRPLEQSVHGNDFWQTDYDQAEGKWRVTFNLLRDGQGKTRLELRQ